MEARRKRKREKAQALYHQAEEKQSEGQHDQAFEIIQTAVNKLENIPFRNRTYDDRRRLANCQDLAGQTLRGNRAESIVWHGKAIQTHGFIPEKRRKIIDWHDCARYEFNMAIDCDDKAERRKHYEAALNYLDHIPEKQLTISDWDFFGDCYRLLGQDHKNDEPAKALQLFKKSIEMYEKIPANKRKPNTREYLAVSHLYAGVMASETYDYASAYYYLNTALKSSALGYADIRKCYQALSLMVVSDAILKVIYNLGADVFFNVNGISAANFKKNILSLSHEILRNKNENQNQLQALILLLQLILRHGLKNDFPNQAITAFLQNEAECVKLTEQLMCLEKASLPPTLATTIENGHNFSLALKLKLRALEDELETVKKALLQDSSTSSLPAANLGITLFGQAEAPKQSVSSEEPAAESSIQYK